MANETLPVARPRWLGVARVAWVVVAAAELVVFAASVPAYWLQLNTLCTEPSRQDCNFTQLTPVMHDAVERLGLTVGAYATYTLAIHVAASLTLLTVGVLVFWRGPQGWYGLFVSLLLVTFGTIGPSAVLTDAFEGAYPELAGTFGVLSWFVFPGLGLFLVTFPDGRFVPRWSVIVVLFWIVQAVFFGAIDALPPPLFAAELLLIWGSTLAVQVYRYRRVSDATQRQQTKWVLFGFALGVSTIIVEVLLNVAFPGYAARGSQLLEGTWVALLFTPIPLSIGIAILKYRLWDIDPIINRTLVYGALTIAVVGIYVFVVGYLGAVFRTGGNLPISLVATGIVAVLFTPLRDRLQRTINRVMYGERDDPYAALSRLGQRLETTLAPDAVLPTAVRTVSEALKSPYVAVELRRGGDYEVVAATGEPTQHTLRLPLVYGGETVGQMVLGLRPGEDDFSAADRRLLDDLARQIGVAVHATRLTDEALRLSADLQRSRERLVTAREEERRRLRRDLHDGLGPQLASLTMKAEAARDLLGPAPERSDALLEEIMAQAQEAVADVRRLVYGLRPPALDALGLVEAIRSHAANQNGLRVELRTPENGSLPPLPAAVEVAAYMISQEALNNAVRHASADGCEIRLSFEDGLLELEVTDDGKGIGEEPQAGVGLHSMRERAEELGGTFVVGPGPSGGTRTTARLPFAYRETGAEA